jgi:hypothetical protein
VGPRSGLKRSSGPPVPKRMRDSLSPRDCVGQAPTRLHCSHCWPPRPDPPSPLRRATRADDRFAIGRTE